MDIIQRLSNNERLIPKVEPKVEPKVYVTKRVVEPQKFELKLPKLIYNTRALQPKRLEHVVSVTHARDFELKLPKSTYDTTLQAKSYGPIIPDARPENIELKLPKLTYDTTLQAKSYEPIIPDARPENIELKLPKTHLPMLDVVLGTDEQPQVKRNYIIPKFTKPEQKPVVPTQNDDIELTPIVIPEITIENKPPVNIARLSYNKKKRNDLAVLLVFFDYIGSARILINYLFMVEKLKLANIPVFTLELVLHGKNPKIHDATHVYGSSYLFQKEHLLRLLEKTIPKHFTKLVCLDADVIFENRAWYDQLSILLDTNHIVQCFDVSYWLDLSYTQTQKMAASCVSADRSKRFWGGQSQPVHPGFGWAFRRNQYREWGYFDKAVIGSGDTLFAYGLLDYPMMEDDRETFIYKKSYANWLALHKQINYTCLNGNLYHLYHGPIPSRQYVSRYEAFKGIENIEDVLAVNNYGVYELTQTRLNKAMFDFFKTRDDDGV